MNHTNRATLLVFATTIIAALPAEAGQWTWDELYKGGNYIEAADELKALLDKGKNTAANNYYYADCLMRLEKVDKALPYYMKVYKMAPQTQFGKFSKQILQKYNRLATKNVTVGVSSTSRAKQLGISTPWDSVQRTTKAPTSVEKVVPTAAAPPTAAPQQDELVRDMQRKLPKLVRTPKPQPTQAELGSWSYSSLAGYYPTAASRVSEAENRLEAAKQLLKEASAKISGSGSPFRKYGESDNETKSRIDATNDAVEKALAPFNDNVTELTMQLSEQQSILQMTVNARNNLYSTPGIGYPIYRRW
jgi:tetratricopeptide (TPR) repeat protein